MAATIAVFSNRVVHSENVDGKVNLPPHGKQFFPRTVTNALLVSDVEDFTDGMPRDVSAWAEVRIVQYGLKRVRVALNCGRGGPEARNNHPDVKLKNGESAVGKKILIDGQQRVTAIMTAIAGVKILTENYTEKCIRIAFNPLAQPGEERFAVTTPAHEKSSFWIPDISEVFKPGFQSWTFMPKYMAVNPDADPNIVGEALQRLTSITACQIGTIVLDPSLDISEVTEIFVRINSQGKRLNESDFAMSKIAADENHGGNMLRKAIDYFCHLAVDPAFYTKLSTTDKKFMQSAYASKLAWLQNDYDDIYDPDYNDMLRVSFMHMFTRGRLGQLVSLLSGRDFETRTYTEEIEADSFDKLSAGVMNFMNEYNFKNFVLAIRSAGFISPKLLRSKMTLDFCYTLFLILQKTGEVAKTDIKHYVQKWFVLSTLTSRYVGSPETQMDRDLREIASKGFVQFLKEAEEAYLSDAFWSVRLVQSLETSAISSPYYNTYVAAQNFLGDRSLLSNSSKVFDLVVVTGDVHHIFPKKYLQDNGYNDKNFYNQVANYAYLDTSVNISVGKKEPKEYFSEALAGCNGIQTVGTITDEAEFWANLDANCIPHEVVNMTYADYTEFLKQRRVRMAQKIRKYYYCL